MICTLASLLIGAATLPPPRTDAPMNVVVFVADDLGWRDLGCTGSSFYETPNLDALAASGARFQQGYASCCVCSPTRVSLMTGKYPARLNTTDYFGGRRAAMLRPAAYNKFLSLQETTLPEALHQAGYATCFLGKWHLGGESFGPLQQGFDVNIGGGRWGHPPKGYFSPFGLPNVPDEDGKHLTDQLTEGALAFLDENKEEPFCLWFSYYSVHTPLEAKSELRDKYVAKREALEPVEPAWLPEGKRKCRQVQDHAVYAGMIETMDTSIGQILARLDTHGLADNTLVVFTSDNGGLSTSEGHPTSNVPLRAGKGWNYEGGLRVPWIVRWPGVTEAGSVIETPIISTDLYPTVLDAVGLDARPAQHVDGESLAPALRSGAQPGRPLYWHYPHYGNQGGSPSGVVRDGDWKLIEFYEDGRIELYDLARDPGEQENLAEVEPARAATLQAQLAAWRRSVDAQMPTTNPEWKG